MIGTSAMLTKEERQILTFAGQGSMTQGIRELIVIYRDLWALGYRPTVPVKFFVRQYGKKKRAPKGPKEEMSTAATQYNPDQGGE